MMVGDGSLVVNNCYSCLRRLLRVDHVVFVIDWLEGWIMVDSGDNHWWLIRAMATNGKSFDGAWVVGNDQWRQQQKGADQQWQQQPLGQKQWKTTGSLAIEEMGGILENR